MLLIKLKNHIQTQSRWYRATELNCIENTTNSPVSDVSGENNKADMARALMGLDPMSLSHQQSCISWSLSQTITKGTTRPKDPSHCLQSSESVKGLVGK